MTKALPERNSALLEKIAAAIEERPDRHNQARWSSIDETVLLRAPETARHWMADLLDESPAEFVRVCTDEDLWCGTTYCVAGWSQALQGRRVVDEWVVYEDGTHRPVIDAAAEDLGLTRNERAQLFAATATPVGGRSFADGLRAFAAGANIDACFRR